VAKAVAQDAEGAWRIPEATSNVGGGKSFGKVDAKGFELALFGVLGGREELLGL
jgi:hypothetical protein